MEDHDDAVFGLEEKEKKPKNLCHSCHVFKAN